MAFDWLQHVADSGVAVLQTLPAVEKAIRESPLQLNPRVEGQEVLVPVPQCAPPLRCSPLHCLMPRLVCSLIPHCVSADAANFTECDVGNVLRLL